MGRLPARINDVSVFPRVWAFVGHPTLTSGDVLGRARVDAVDALVERLEALHRETPLNTVILGRGSLPPDPPSTP